MTAQNIFNCIALIINMTGAYMMYHYTPKTDSRLFLYTRAEDEKMHKKDLHKNKMVRIGMLLLFFGFIFQFVAFFINS